MKQVLLICAGGMSSSLMAKKVTSFFKERNYEIELTATSVVSGEKAIRVGAYDLYLVSPQIRMYLDRMTKLAEAGNQKVASVPGPAYVPVEKGIKAMARLVIDNI